MLFYRLGLLAVLLNTVFSASIPPSDEVDDISSSTAPRLELGSDTYATSPISKRESERYEFKLSFEGFAPDEAFKELKTLKSSLEIYYDPQPPNGPVKWSYFMETSVVILEIDSTAEAYVKSWLNNNKSTYYGSWSVTEEGPI